MRAFRLLTACFVLFAVAGAAFAQSAVRPIEADRIVAVVNDEAITMYELQSRLATAERQLRKQGTQLPPRDVMMRQMLERMIMERVQLQYAKETGIQVPDVDLDEALRRIADSNKLSLPDFKAALEKDGIAWPKFREEIRGEMIITRLRQREVDSRVVVSEGEIDNFLANPKNVAGDGVVVDLSHIVIRVPEQADPGQLMRLAARARKALEQIKAGEDFGKVAATYSDAPDGLSGGSMGPRPLDRLPTLYAEAVQKMNPGDVSDIMRSPAGFHIIKLVDRHGGAPLQRAVMQTHASHILIKVNELVSDADAQRKLMSIRDRLEHGASFAELARLYSNDLSAAKGGDLGWLYPGDTVPEFERAMNALKVGEISQPVRSPFGWHLILVQGRRTDEASPERQRQLARQALHERKADEAYEDWLRQLRDRAYVEYHLDDQ